jgi:NAD(P)-dependent dehydrogenase (short-subunit alcohol dehydrogenase family)
VPTGTEPDRGSRHGTVVVTGAAGGIGSAALDIEDDDGRPLAAPVAAAVRAAGGAAVAVAADLRDPDALDDAVATAVAELGPVSGLFANAGLLRGGSVEELGSLEWQESLDVNATGTWNTVRAVLPHFRASGGGIVLTSSVAGAKGTCGFVGYVTAKHAVVGLMRALAHELGPRSIRVNTVHPTAVRTPMIDNEDQAERRTGMRGPEGMAALRDVYAARHLLPIAWLEPEDVAHAAAWLLSDEARYVTGVSLPVDAGMLAK